MRVRINFVGIGLLICLLFLVFYYYGQRSAEPRPKSTQKDILTISAENDRPTLQGEKKTTALASTNDAEESNRIKFTQLQYGLDGLEHSQEVKSRHFKEELEGVKEFQNQILEKQERYNEIQKEFLDRQKKLEEILMNLKKQFDDEHDERMKEREYGLKKLHRLIRAEKEIKKQRKEQAKQQQKDDKAQKEENQSLEEKAKRMEEEQLKHELEQAKYQEEEER